MTKENVELSSVEMDRAIGAVIGGAVGDGLGTGFEFATAPQPDEVEMRRATLTEAPAGYWTDDTAIAIAILEVAERAGNGSLMRTCSYFRCALTFGSRRIIRIPCMR